MSDETREIYAPPRLGQSVPLGARPAILVVDFSRGFTDPESTMGSELTREVEATNRLLAAAREREIPVIFTTIGFEPNLKDGYPTLVPRECVGDRAQAPHEANLVDIQAKYADVVSVEDALAYIESVSRKSGAPV